MKSFLILQLCILSLTIAAQDKKFEEVNPDIEWNQGSILLNNGKELKGLIRFNDRVSIISYENGDEKGSYTSRNVTAFEFFDSRLNQQRLFYSLEFEDPQTNAKRPLFFEVLKDFKEFSVISKIDPITVRDKSTSPNPVDPVGVGPTVIAGIQNSGTEILQKETIYFFSNDDGIEPYVQITRKVVDRKLYDRKKMKRKFIDDDLIKKYFKEPGLSKMIQFATDNDLEFDVKEDLIKILNSYTE